MNSKRVYILIIVVIAMLIAGLLAGAYGVDTLMQKESKKLVSLKAQSQALNQERSNLAKDKRDIVTYEPLAKIAKTIVPQDKDQAEAVREIVKIADNNGIGLGAISFPASTLGSEVPSAASAGTSSSSSPSSAPTASPSLSQLAAVPDISGVYELQIIVQQDSANPVPYNSFINFLQDLERNRRTAQVNGITLQPDPKNPGLLTFTLTLDEYIKP